MKRFIPLLLFIGLAWGQTSIDSLDTCAQAALDARNDVKKSLWIEAGFSTGMFSNKLANSLIPNPKIENIIGKSDDYIIAYNDCYKKEANKLQNSYARIGCCSKALFLPL